MALTAQVTLHAPHVWSPPWLCWTMLSISEQQEQRWACAASYISILVETGSKEAASVRMRSLNLAAIICSLPIPSFLQLRVDCMTMYLTYILRFYKKGTKMYLCFWSANNHFMTPDPYPVSLWVAYPAAKEETLVLHSFINNQVFLQVVWFFNYILLVIPLYFYMKLHYTLALCHIYIYMQQSSFALNGASYILYWALVQM